MPKTEVLPKIQQLIKSEKRYKIAHGGRGSGKSYGIAQVLVHRAIAEKARFLCTRQIQNTLSDSALAIMKRVIADCGLDNYFTMTEHGLSCASGSEFIFRGLQNPDRIKSLDGVKYCWVEEAHSVSKNALTMLIPTIREPGSELWFTFNPDQETDPSYEMFVGGNREDATVVQVNWQDNPFFPDVLRQEMEYDKRNDYEKYLHVWEGHCRTISEAQVFKGKYRVAAFETPPGMRYYYGADWGFSQDPTVLIRCFIKNQILWIDHEAYGVGVDIDNTPAMFERDVPDSKRWPIAADSARPETISYIRKNGFQIHGAIKGKGSVEDGVQFIRSFRGVVVHERCKHTADDFRLYKYKEDRLTGEILPDLEDKNNNCIDAIRYALERLMRSIGSIGNLGLAAEMGL